MRTLRSLTIGVAAVALLAGCGVAAGDTPAAPQLLASGRRTPAPPVRSTPAVVRPLVGPAADALAKLPVKGRAPMTGYTRDQFGQAWADTDGNGCDQRNDVLRRDLANTTLAPFTHDCVVASGTLYDRYTGKVIRFVRGPQSGAVQIDHVVPLSDAWQKGAQQLPAARRQALATDLLNLVATDGPTNESKGDSDAASWLPPSHVERCDYVARQVAVKTRYGLWVTPAEHDAIAAMLRDCPGQVLPNR